MTYPSSLLIHLLAIGTIIMIACLVPRIREEAQEPGVVAYQNKAFWLMVALVTHGIGALALMVAALIAQPEMKVGAVLYWLWFGWAAWFASKTTIIYVLGQLRVALGIYALWIIGWLTWQGFFV